MTQPGSIEPCNPEAVADYRRQSRAFLGRAREYLAADDLHQASEKGWGAAAWMAKAVAVAQAWEYRQHAQFGVVLNSARELTGNDRLRLLSVVAYGLHQDYYIRKRFLDDRAIGLSLEDMSDLLDILEPLTVPTNEQETD